MDFLAESFYPILILWSIYFVATGKRFCFWAAALGVLLVKEDAPLYMLGLGFFLLFIPKRRTYGVGVILLSLAYALFLIKIFAPITQSNILVRSSMNFQATGATPQEILSYHLTHPVIYFKHLFWPSQKLQTILKLLEFTFFIPLLSPWFLLVLLSLLPPFAQGEINFIDLRFHYSAVVIPFLFAAFVMGLQNLDRALKVYPAREFILRFLILALVIATSGNYMSHSLSSFQFKTIREVSRIPRGALLVTQGALLPYVGYRTLNIYFSEPYELEEDAYHDIYNNADYYFLARSINSYPYDHSWIEKKIEGLKKDPRLNLVYDDGERVLFKRKDKPYPIGPEKIPLHHYLTVKVNE
jgi:uncharacterized membrane protein